MTYSLAAEFLWHTVNARHPVINAESWYWDEIGGWSAPASKSSTSPYCFLCGAARCHLSVLESPGGLQQVFPNLHTWLPHPVRDSAVHEPSAVTSHWARKRCKSSQSLIDTHEKSLLVVLLTQDIIRWQAVHWPEKDIVKLRKHYRQWSQFNVIESCLPKCYLIAWLRSESFMQLCAADKHSTGLAMFPY